VRGERVIVIGAGVLGAASAWALARGGARVTVLEQFAVGHDRGSSHGHARIFRLGYPEDHYVELALRALSGWRQLERATGASVLALTGAVDHGDPAELATIAAALERNGVAVERLTPGAAHARWPGLLFDREAVAHAEGGRVDAEAAVDAFLAAARSHGAEVREGVRVVAVGEDGVVTTADRGALRADAVVVATGGWTAKLLPAVPIAPTLQQPVHLVARSEETWPSFVHYADPPVYGLAEPGAGIKLGEHVPGRAIDPDDDRRRADPVALARLIAYAERWLPGVDPRSARPLLCVYESTPTTDPVIDRFGRIVVAAGFSGHGFKFAPAVGDLVAGLVAGEATRPFLHLSERAPRA
jgi:sarcosine oxidase